MKEKGPYTLILCNRHRSFSIQEDRMVYLLELLGKITQKVIILGLNLEEGIKVKEQGIVFFSEVDFEKEGLLNDINETAIRMATEWYQLPQIRNFLEYQGVNLGEVIQHPMTYFLLQPLKDIAVLDFLISRGLIHRCYFCGKEKSKEIFEEKYSVNHLLEEWDTPVLSEYLQMSHDLKSYVRKLSGILWKVFNLAFNTINIRKTKTILISSDFKHITPMVKHFAEDEDTRLVYLRDNYAIRHFLFFLKERISFYICASSCRTPRQNEWDTFSQIVIDSKAFFYKGVSFWPFIALAFKEEYYSKIEYFRQRIKAFYKFLRRIDVSCILVDEDVCPFNKSLIFVANQLKIPSLVIQHGAPFESVPIALAPVSCSKIAAWGEYSKELLMKWKVPESKIEITGVPRYDKLLNYRKVMDEITFNVKKEFGIKAGKLFAVFAMDPFHEPGRSDFTGIYLTQKDLRELMHLVVQVSNSFPNLELIIKLHPRDQHESHFHQWLQEAKPNRTIRVLRSYPTYKLVLACDFLMTICSTVAIEALLCYKPVVALNIRGGADLQPHCQNGVAIRAGTKGELENAIKDIEQNGEMVQKIKRMRETVIPYYIYSEDGRASERVAKIVRKLMEETNVTSSISGKDEVA